MVLVANMIVHWYLVRYAIATEYCTWLSGEGEGDSNLYAHMCQILVSCILRRP